MAVHLDSWVQSLPPCFQMWAPDAFDSDTPPSAAQLNTWLLHFYSITQLTRPFLLAHIRNMHSRTDAPLRGLNDCRQDGMEVKKFAEACIRAASRTTRTIHAAMAKGLTSESNSFFV